MAKVARDSVPNLNGIATLLETGLLMSLLEEMLGGIRSNVAYATSLLILDSMPSRPREAELRIVMQIDIADSEG